MTQPTKRVLFTASPSLKVKRQTFAAGENGAAAGGGEKTTLSGYAILWNQLSDDRGGFFVRFLPGSVHFATPTFAIFHHDFRVILGSTANSTLRLTSDDVGVRVEIDLPATTQAADVATLVDGGYVSGMSFSMLYDDILVTTNKTENGQDIVEVSAFTCDEVTVTAIPAFTATSITVKTADKPAPDRPAEASVETPRTENHASARAAHALRLQQMKLNHLSL